MKKEENIDLLFNCFQTAYRRRSARKSGHAGDVRRLKQMSREQKRRLLFLFRGLKSAGAIEKILAVYKMQPVYLDFCPPLVPQLIAQCLIERRAQKNVAVRLRQLGKLYGKSFSMKPLHRIRWKILRTKLKREYGYLIRFLKNFVQFHRDYQDCMAIRAAMDQINMTSEAKIVNLSRVNNTLYEFLLPHERRFQEKPISSHVILKADLRGSTAITKRMMARALNPASYFSLNFFDPITEILPDYGAEKVFVEGDAIILSIFEREGDPAGRYSVARACGLAVSILSIVNTCNLRNGKYRLPGIELGIGITYAAGRPAFLFDGDQRIMISSAINIADRLSGCSKKLKQVLLKENTPFNLYVFQSVSDEDVLLAEDDIFLRYNVNGIELSEAGFRNLREEIELRPFTVDISVATRGTRMKFYTGKFPLINGEFQRLVLREAPIVRIDVEKFKSKGLTGRKYYEICTNLKLRTIAEKPPVGRSFIAVFLSNIFRFCRLRLASVDKGIKLQFYAAKVDIQKMGALTMVTLKKKDKYTIGVMSDTHGLLRDGVYQAFEAVDLIIHAGDVGGIDVLMALKKNGTGRRWCRETWTVNGRRIPWRPSRWFPLEML